MKCLETIESSDGRFFRLLSNEEKVTDVEDHNINDNNIQDETRELDPM